MTVRNQHLLREFNRVDERVTRWMARSGVTLLRISMGIIFVWFGALKLIPSLSPAETLIRETITFVPMALFLPLLAIWEILIGVGFITGKFMRAAILLLFLQMPGTLSPVLLRPDLVFTTFPFVLTIEGQYIVKNLVLISAALVIGATVRGGGLISDPLQRRGLSDAEQ
ncbi:DoxX family protein [Candidatus Flexifilum breve]|uniref:DoxX family protein n=1 Tax=Candidatus Flexifilum breve TaxID=3140694 RepID=UPI0031CCAAEF